MKNVTGIVVTHNTKQIFETCYNSIRKFHPDMHIIIVDGSDKNDACRAYVESLVNENTSLYIAEENIGPGRGMHFAINLVDTEFAFIFDSDIVMLRSPLQAMIDLFEDDTYGVGNLEKTGMDGYCYRVDSRHIGEDYCYIIHPFCHMIRVREYYRYHPYVHHGQPCCYTGIDIYNKGLRGIVQKALPRLGHTRGHGVAYEVFEPYWVIHDVAGTRNTRKRKGKPEIEGKWQ